MIDKIHTNSSLLHTGIALLLFGIFANGCGPGEYFPNNGTDRNDAPTIVKVTQRMDNNNFVLLKHEVAAIELPANLSTGYRWTMQDMDDGFTRIVGTEYRQENTGLLGTPGTQIIYLAGSGNGTQTIHFSYSPVTNPNNVIQTAEFRVKVD